MGKYKRWINTNLPGQTCYVTSTCLDFAHLFARNSVKTRMALSILRDCKFYGAKLHAFVIMSHHLHLLVTPKSDETISGLMRNVKRRSANILKPMLTEFEKRQLGGQMGLNHHSFWKEGFRGLPVFTSLVFQQKLNYIHENPVRAEIETYAAAYNWSSAKQYEAGNFVDENLLDLDKCIQFYERLL